MFARRLDSRMVAFAVIGALCGSCGINDGAGDHDTGQAPSKPPDPPGVVTDGSLPAKPAVSRTAIAPDSTDWTLDLEASPALLWPSQYTTLTATTNMDVGPVNYQISIWDSKTGIFLNSCYSGTTCSVAVTRANADFTSFTAVVTPAVANGVGVAVVSAFTDVYWHTTSIWLTETAPTVPLGGTTTLTAITDDDIELSPFFVEIYDVTTGTLVTRCGGGTRCSVNVTHSTATTHRYRACFTVASASFPPPNALKCTVDQAVSWANASTSGRVLLTVTPASGGTYTVTATSSISVSGTSNQIQIYALESGTRIAACRTGTTCSTPVPQRATVQTMVGFVGPSSTTPPVSPPSGTVQSNSLTVPGPPMGCQGAPVTQGPVIGPSGIPGGTPFL